MLDELLGEFEQGRQEEGKKRKRRKELQDEYHLPSSMTDKQMEDEDFKRKSKARYEAIKALGNGR